MIVYLVLICLLFLSVISDLKASKIRNIFVFPAALLGIIINAYSYGLSGFRSSIMGIVMPIVLLGILFCARLIGAGDIKLFSAIGAFLGWK
jgi:prepilin peptidase CpaA